jgi:hypothetical protein
MGARNKDTRWLCAVIRRIASLCPFCGPTRQYGTPVTTSHCSITNYSGLNCSTTISMACKGLRLPAVQAGNLILSTAPCPVAGLLLMLVRAKCNPHGTRNLNYLRSVTVGNKMSLSTQGKGLVFEIYHQTPHQRLPISPQP